MYTYMFIYISIDGYVCQYISWGGASVDGLVGNLRLKNTGSYGPREVQAKGRGGLTFPKEQNQSLVLFI